MIVIYVSFSFGGSVYVTETGVAPLNFLKNKNKIVFYRLIAF